MLANLGAKLAIFSGTLLSICFIASAASMILPLMPAMTAKPFTALPKLFLAIRPATVTNVPMPVKAIAILPNLGARLLKSDGTLSLTCFIASANSSISLITP